MPHVMHVQLLVWLIVAGLSLICSALTLSTQTHCILVTSGDKKHQPVCPGEAVNVDTHVEIVAGFDDNSKSEKSQTPLWQQSFSIEPRSVVDMRGPGFSAPMQTAYWGTDNCLYGNPNMYPIIAPPVFYKPNKEYVRMGCATKAYSGPAIANPWNMRNYGTTTIPDTIEPLPDTTEPSGSGDDFLDQLRFFRDYQPLYRVLHDGKTKSEDDQKNSDASPFDTSLFNTDLANQVDYTAFLPSSDDSTNSDISWNVNTDPGSNYIANLDLGTDLFANTDTGTILDANTYTGSSLDANTDTGSNTYNFGSGLFASTISFSDSSSDSGSDPSSGSDSNNYDIFGDLFSKKRTRRSARDFLRQDKA